MSKGVQIAGGATLIALLLGWYAASNLEAGSSFTYYQNLVEFQRVADEQTGRHARVHGYVAPGSIDRNVPEKRVRFVMRNDPPHAAKGPEPTAPLDVIVASLETPDLFKDGAEVVVEGRLLRADGQAVFHADKVLAKCPSKFQPQGREAAAGESSPAKSLPDSS